MSRQRRACMLRWLAAAVFLAGTMTATVAVSIPAKAVVAQVLLERAWARTQQDGQPHRPWPWAEHWPLGRLHFPTLDASVIVLEGDSGDVLAFAPGRSPQSGALGGDRTSVISAHRDTHFRLLERLRAGDPVTVEHGDGARSYRVSDMRVVDAGETVVRVRDAAELVLVTCWPFDAVSAGGAERYVVTATADGA